MKRYAVLTVFVALTAQAATAQLQNRYQGNNPRDVAAGGENYLQESRYNAERRIGTAETDRQCLRERKTGRVHCRTHAEWEIAAKRIEAGRSWR